MSQAANLLTNEEIDALTAGIHDGSVATNTGYNTGISIRKHDLTNEDSSLGVNISSLDMINERFIRLFRLAMLDVLRTSPKINPSRAQLLKFGDYMKDLSPPLSVNIIRVNPLRGNAMVLIDPNVVFTSLDNFFGGFGRGIGQLAPGRLFTPTETRVIDLILDVIFGALKEAWVPLLAVDFEKISSEINPHFAQIADENDLVIVNHFDAECGDGNNGFLDVVYPYSAIKPIRDLLKNRMSSDDGDASSKNLWHADLASAVGDAKLEIRVLIGSLTIALGQLESVKEDDVIFFNKTDYARVNISGIPVFDARVGTSGPNTSIRIEKILEQSPDT